MVHFLKPVTFICSMAGLAACGGGTTGNNGGAGGGGTFSFDNKADFEVLQNETMFTRTEPANLPGSAEYAGFVQVSSLNNAVPAIVGTEAVGVATFSVDFAGAGSLTGSATDFQDAAGTYTGTLNITDGTIGVGGAGETLATADVNGTLTRETGEVITIDGNTQGRFFGDNGDWLVGASTAATGTVDGTSGDIDIAIHGALQ